MAIAATAHCTNRRSRRSRFARRPAVRDGEDPAGVRAGRHLPSRPSPSGAEGTRSVPVDPLRRQDGQGRVADRDPQRPTARGDHEGQRACPGQRGRVFSDRRAEGGDRSGGELHERHVADRTDDAPLRARPARASRTTAPRPSTGSASSTTARSPSSRRNWAPWATSSSSSRSPASTP